VEHACFPRETRVAQNQRIRVAGNLHYPGAMTSPDAQPALDCHHGMTVNEGLTVANLTGEFDPAAGRRDRAAMIAVLLRVGLDEKQAASTADALLANPKHSGC
jgi:hypothetical protein